MTELTLRKIDDMHLHLRQGAMLKSVLPYSAKQCARAVIMPNTLPPVLTPKDVTRYEKEINAAGTGLEPLMTFKLVASTTPESILGLKKAGVVAGKLYPEGVTTNSEDGVSDFEAMYPVYQAMEKAGLVLCLHGEMPGAFCMDRESAFLETFKRITTDFPNLKIVLEHVTTQDAVEAVKKAGPNVGATITVHHMAITLDDVVGDKINPHNFCKPIAKRPDDRDALVAAATSGNAKFFLGTDSAPHTIESKECACGAAGVYTAPVVLPVLADIFEANQALDHLEAFTSINGATFYGLPLNEETITLHKKSWDVASSYDGVVPFMAGKTLAWQVV